MSREFEPFATDDEGWEHWACRDEHTDHAPSVACSCNPDPYMEITPHFWAHHRFGA